MQHRPSLTPTWLLWAPTKPRRWLVVPLVVAIGLYVAAMRIPWHHQLIRGGSTYTVVYGINSESWLLAVAAIAVLFAVRFFVERPGGYSRFVLTFVAFLTVIGIYGDYVDWQDRAAQSNNEAYFGPGFYVGLAGTGALVAAAALTWLARD
jgi:hypothetical protein